ncbi:vezatin isoform X2 [Protobothrops mucrosquamatus]|uniref:vezatin isoform X2 n=1 Tax=Protobothrops mucrosquamatus TaxID=103944 RepID=UPI000775AA5B|nr:vezatin isoform X2 [Protobothrops mucrosquamatus]
MTPEFDDEVVFENSPLYQYLQDLGHTDFEICSPLLQKSEECTSKEGSKDMDVSVIQEKDILSNLVEILKSWLPFSLYKKRHDILHQLDVGFRSDALCAILQQEVLLQEDVELIELFDPSILSAGQLKQQEYGHLPTLCSLATPNIWDISLLFLFISTLVMIPSLWSGFLGLILGVVFLVYITMRGLDITRIAKLQMSLKKCHLQLEDVMVNCRAFTNLVRKALRLIQETEVISRGFTLLLDRVSAACPYNKGGQHPCQHLIGLRKAVYRSVRANFRASRLATLYMLKHYPLNSESDNVTNYICVVPFKELGLGLNEEQVSEEEAHNLTDGFSLPALKVLFQLWVGQSSEFFRRLLLLLSPSNASLRSLITPESLPLCIFSDIIQGLPHAHAACLEELKRSYEFYRYFETHHQSYLERPVKAKPKSGSLSHLHTAVRSLQLHLKALLNEMIILEDELEKVMNSKESPELIWEAYQIADQKLKLIQPHMHASNSCWEEAISQVEKMIRRNSDKKGKSEPSCENKHCTTVPLTQPTVHIEDKDPVPEEQELEAYVDDTDMDECKRDDFYYFSLEDTQRQKCEREESKRVLQELKSVLGFKASEAERQKWKQLLFSDQVNTSTLENCVPNSELLKNSDRDKQDCSKNENLEETISDHKMNVPKNEKGKVEYLFDGLGVNEHDVVAIAASPEVEKRTCSQCNGEGEESKQSAVGRVSMIEPSENKQSSIKQRLAELHISTDFNFTSGLAAQVAAKSLTFRTMKEQMFGEDEEAMEIQENEDNFEKTENT